MHRSCAVNLIMKNLNKCIKEKKKKLYTGRKKDIGETGGVGYTVHIHIFGQDKYQCLGLGSVKFTVSPLHTLSKLNWQDSNKTAHFGEDRTVCTR